MPRPNGNIIDEKQNRNANNPHANLPTWQSQKTTQFLKYFENMGQSAHVRPLEITNAPTSHQQWFNTRLNHTKQTNKSIRKLIMM